MTTNETITAPRFENGEKLGRFPATIVRHMVNDWYVVRFEDGHEAGAFEYEIERCVA